MLHKQVESWLQNQLWPLPTMLTLNPFLIYLGNSSPFNLTIHALNAWMHPWVTCGTSFWSWRPCACLPRANHIHLRNGLILILFSSPAHPLLHALPVVDIACKNGPVKALMFFDGFLQLLTVCNILRFFWFLWSYLIGFYRFYIFIYGFKNW